MMETSEGVKCRGAAVAVVSELCLFHLNVVEVPGSIAGRNSYAQTTLTR
jgi:hypothetical protein